MKVKTFQILTVIALLLLVTSSNGQSIPNYDFAVAGAPGKSAVPLQRIKVSTISFVNFQELPKLDKVELVEQQGIYLLTRKRMGKKIDLYWVGDSFAEVMTRGKKKNVRRFAQVDWLRNYSDKSQSYLEKLEAINFQLIAARSNFVLGKECRCIAKGR